MSPISSLLGRSPTENPTPRSTHVTNRGARAATVPVGRISVVPFYLPGARTNTGDAPRVNVAEFVGANGRRLPAVHSSARGDVTHFPHMFLLVKFAVAGVSRAARDRSRVSGYPRARLSASLSAARRSTCVRLCGDSTAGSDRHVLFRRAANERASSGEPGNHQLARRLGSE